MKNVGLDVSLTVKSAVVEFSNITCSKVTFHANEPHRNVGSIYRRITNAYMWS